jgi:polyhydroxyalkanoate synthesis regulator phasin
LASGLAHIFELLSWTFSWYFNIAQKKKLLKILQDTKDKFKSIEAKLISGAQLTPAEQTVYDSNSGEIVTVNFVGQDRPWLVSDVSGVDDEKITWLQGEIKKMVDGGKLTSAEKTEVLEHLTHNIASCTEEIEKCKAAGENAKKIEKLNEKKAAIVERKNAVNAVAPITHRLKHSDEIQKLEMQVLALHALEEKGRSCSLTIADLKLLENKSTLESQVLLGFLARIRISILRFGIFIFVSPDCGAARQ